MICNVNSHPITPYAITLLTLGRCQPLDFRDATAVDLRRWGLPVS